MPYGFARRMGCMRPSTIREILKATAQPDMISLAGGLPAPELFPVEAIDLAARAVLREQGPKALQYGESEGYGPLREHISWMMSKRGVACGKDDLLVTSGSQQILDLVGKVFVNPGDRILTENPTYLAAIQAFQAFEAELIPVPTDDDGLVPEAMPELIERHKPKFLYTIPDFRNPTGTTLAKERRRKLYSVLERYGMPAVEDDPYSSLRYRGEWIPPLKSLDTQGLIIYSSTFSKTLAPGLRLGWAVCPPGIMRALVVAKQASDLHTSSFDQMVAHRYLIDNDTDKHVEMIRKEYGERHAAMDEALGRELPDGYQWTRPEGGMFLWVTCPDAIDTGELLERAIEHNVLFVPGRDFFPDGSGKSHMRLNFSNATPDRIREGVRRLAALCESYRASSGA